MRLDFPVCARPFGVERVHEGQRLHPVGDSFLVVGPSPLDRVPQQRNCLQVRVDPVGGGSDSRVPHVVRRGFPERRVSYPSLEASRSR